MTKYWARIAWIGLSIPAVACVGSAGDSDANSSAITSQLSWYGTQSVSEGSTHETTFFSPRIHVSGNSVSLLSVNCEGGQCNGQKQLQVRGGTRSGETITWQPSTTLRGDSTSCEKFDSALDAKGTIHVVAACDQKDATSGSTTWAIRYVTVSSDGKEAAPTDLTRASAVNVFDPAIALDDSGMPVVAWAEWQGSANPKGSPLAAIHVAAKDASGAFKDQAIVPTLLSSASAGSSASHLGEGSLAYGAHLVVTGSGSAAIAHLVYILVEKGGKCTDVMASWEAASVCRMGHYSTIDLGSGSAEDVALAVVSKQAGDPFGPGSEPTIAKGQNALYFAYTYSSEPVGTQHPYKTRFLSRPMTGGVSSAEWKVLGSMGAVASGPDTAVETPTDLSQLGPTSWMRFAPSLVVRRSAGAPGDTLYFVTRLEDFVKGSAVHSRVVGGSVQVDSTGKGTVHASSAFVIGAYGEQSHGSVSPALAPAGDGLVAAWISDNTGPLQYAFSQSLPAAAAASADTRKAETTQVKARPPGVKTPFGKSRSTKS